MDFAAVEMAKQFVFVQKEILPVNSAKYLYVTLNVRMVEVVWGMVSRLNVPVCLDLRGNHVKKK